MAALNELLATRVSALAAHDAAAWTATIADPAGTAGVAELAAYQGLVALGVRDLVVGDGPPGPGHAGGTSGSASVGVSDSWTASVRLGYTIPGFDRGTRWVSRTVTLARADGRWRIQSWRGPADRWEPFDLPDLQVVRTERSLVAGPVSLDVLRARLADVDLGQDQVAAVLILEAALEAERATGSEPGELVSTGGRKPRTKGRA